MTAPMVAWMRFRGMAARPTAEMAAAMVVLALLILVAGWSGIVAMESLLWLAHGLMMPAMLVVAFALGPDLAVLYGIAPGLVRGQLHPRGVSLHSALHRFWGPLGLMTVAVIAGLPSGWIASALAWAFDVAFDRAIGLRLRSPNGFQRVEAT